MNCIKIACLMMAGLCTSLLIRAQSVADSTKIIASSSRFIHQTQDKVDALTSKLIKQTEKDLLKMHRQEKLLRARMDSQDGDSQDGDLQGGGSPGGRLASADQQYDALISKIKSDAGGRSVVPSGGYLANLDSVQGVLKFLAQKNNDLPEAQKALGQLTALEAKMQDAELVKQFISQRRAQISNYLEHYTNLPSGVTGVFANYKKQAYYYSQQVQAYKEELNDPDKLLKRALTELNRLPSFASFMKKNSMLAGLFNMPSGPSSASSSTGLLSRDQLTASLPGGDQGLTQSIGNAPGQVDGLRDKLNSEGAGGGGDLDVPDFKPNPQHTKSFFRRLELGTNLQSTSSSVYFPTTTDLGLSLGYRLDSKNVIGIGVSYKLGWGRDIQHVSMSSQGVGLRSFADINISKTFFATGGFEYNYQHPFSIQGFPSHPDDWQKSGLIGISKIISMKRRPFKNTELQLLWDFLSYGNGPQTQPLKFRVGYSL
jgi:hypothetical protein